MPNNVKLQVASPSPGGSLMPVAYKDHAGNPFWLIAVHGTAHGINRLAATLVRCDDDGTRHAYVGKPIKAHAGKPTKNGLHWVFGFEALPQVPTQPQAYFLTVTPIDVDVSNAKMVRFTVLTPVEIDSKRDPIPILNPQSNTTVCPAFVAWGRNGNNGPPTRAAMKGSGGQVFPGALVPPVGQNPPVNPNGPPNGTWMFNFANLPDDDYTFYVDNDPTPYPAAGFPTPSTAATTDRNQSIDVTVDSTNCGPVAPPPGPGPVGP